jgi:hypothetical protein
MRFLHDDFAFELPEKWWREAGMVGVVIRGKSYQPDLSAFPKRSVYFVPLNRVQPVRRQLSHGVFNSDLETGLTAKERVLTILRGFLAGNAIPPVEVVELPPGHDFSHELIHGAHRFYCSLAAGFTEVPAVDGFRL